MHDEVAALERVVEVGAAPGAARPAVHTAPAREVGLGDDREAHGRHDDATLEGRDDDADLARRHAADRGDAFAGEHVVEATGRPFSVGGEHHAGAAVAQVS